MLNFETYTKDTNTDWVILIHALGGSILTWKKQVDVFSDKYNLLIIDLPGHGDSQNEDEYEYNAKTINEKLLEVIDYLGIKKAIFIGLSLGTLVIANFAAEYPEYVKEIILGGAVIRITGFNKICMIAAKIGIAIFPHKFLYRLISYFVLPKKHHKKSRDIFIKEVFKMSRNSLVSWMKYISMITDSQYIIDKLNKFNIKTLFIMGAEDIFFIRDAKKVANSLKNSSLKLRGA